MKSNSTKLKVSNLEAKEKTTGKNSLFRQQIMSMVMTLVIVGCSTVVSATMWFRQSFDEIVPTLPCEIRVQLVKDIDQPYMGDNLIWSSGVLGVTYIDQTISLDLKQDTAVYAIVSNLYGYEEVAQYELQVSQGERVLLESVTQGKGFRFLLEKGKSKIYPPVHLKASDESIHIQLRTALQDEKIFTASTVEELTQKEYPAKSVVYLTGDIHHDGELLFDKSYPIINLSGYTLSCKSVTVSAAKGTFGEMKITNGIFKVGDKQYTNDDVIESTGEGRVLINFSNLR